MSFLSREKAQKALWFAETYGLRLKSLAMEDPSGHPISIDFMSDTSSSASGQNKESYANLDDEEKEKVKTILFIMDFFQFHWKVNLKYTTKVPC